MKEHKQHTVFMRKAHAFLADFILMSAGLALLAQLFAVAIPVAAVLSALRSGEKYRRAKWMFVAYWLLVILTLDTAVMISMMAVMSLGSIFFAAPVIVYAATLIARKRTGFMGHLTMVQLTLIPLFLWGSMLVLPVALKNISQGEFRDSECARIILPGRKDSYPLFIEERFGGDVIAGFRLAPNGPMNYVGNRPSISRIDRATGEESVWLDVGLALAVKYDLRTGRTFAVVGRTNAEEMRNHPHMQLYVFDSEGNVEERHDLNLPRSSYYIACIVPMDDRVIVIVENSWFEYRRSGKSVVRLDPEKLVKGAPVYACATLGDRLVGVFTPGYLLLSIITGQRNMIAVDLREMKYLKSRRGTVRGYYDIEQVPGTDHFIASHTWVKGGVVIDAGLERIGEVDIPAGVRNIAIDKSGKTLAAGGYFDGRLYFLDLESNRKTGDVYVGKGIRGITYTADNHVLVGSKIGLIEVSPEICK